MKNTGYAKFSWSVFSIATVLLLLLNSIAFSTPIVIDSAVNPDNSHNYYLLSSSS